MADGELVTCALKRIAYASDEEKAVVNAELANLRDVVAGSYNTTCIGVFDEWCPTQRKEYLWVALE